MREGSPGVNNQVNGFLDPASEPKGCGGAVIPVYTGLYNAARTLRVASTGRPTRRGGNGGLALVRG